MSFALVPVHWIFAFLAIAVIIGAGLRVPKEEQMLVGQFGHEYRQSMEWTGRYLPR